MGEPAGAGRNTTGPRSTLTLGGVEFPCVASDPPPPDGGGVPGFVGELGGGGDGVGVDVVPSVEPAPELSPPDGGGGLVPLLGGLDVEPDGVPDVEPGGVPEAAPEPLGVVVPSSR